MITTFILLHVKCHEYKTCHLKYLFFLSIVILHKLHFFASKIPLQKKNKNKLHIAAPYESDNDNNDNDYDAATTITSLEKRHLGALARSGWIPSFRPTRNRFSRSGRTENMEQIVK